MKQSPLTEHVDSTEASAGHRRGGRPRDASRDALILQETLAVLAESGYDGLTIDKVAARVGAARATIYRRWPTKADLVLQAVQHLSRDDAGVDHLPDTGTLRGDLVAMVLRQNEQEQEYRLRVLAGVASLALTEDPRLGQAAATAGVGAWAEAVELLLSRAVDRGEYSPTDVQAVAQVMPMMCLARAVTRQPLTHEFSLALIDGVVLPAMRGGR
jgi:AcrR family transcriptional regulator